jgi:NADPH:quinone reductase-like Zn-dependent oxidoreductase
MKENAPRSKIPDLMNAIRLHAPGGLDGLIYEQIKTPQPEAGEVLVRVYAAAITRDELDWPVNRLPAIPSYEFSGIIVAVASTSENRRIGEAVYALSAFDHDGAAAEYVAVPAEILASKPQRLNYIESAALPLAGLSAWQGLFEHGNLVSGQRVLIHGAAGGVGGLAVQLARQRGAYVFGTVSTKNMAAAQKLGADEVIDYTTTPFEAVVGQVDLVFDTAGGDRLARSPSVVRPGGRLVSIAAEPPREGTTGRMLHSTYFVVTPNREQLMELTRLNGSGVLSPTIDRVFPLAAARKAFERSMGEHGAGKIVLQIADEPE